MIQYINKADVVGQANIEITACRIAAKEGILTEFGRGKLEALEGIVDFLNTLEEKKIDLDKEARHYLLNKHLSPLNEVMHQADLKAEMQYHEDIENAFKAGFKLGLKVNFPITANDRGLAEEIIINLKRVEKDYRIDLTKEIEWLRNKTQKI